MANVRDDRRPPTLTAGHRRRIIKETADLLEESETVRDPNIRVLLLRELDLALGFPLQLREVGLLRPQLVQLVTACVEHTGGLRSLAECLDLLESDVARVHALLRLADEWQVFEQFARHNLSWLRSELVGMRLSADLRSFVAEHRVEPVPVYCESAWHVFAHLASVPESDDVPPWLRLLERMATKVPARSRARLTDLVRELSDEWGVPEPAAARAASAAPENPGTAYIVIQFEKYGGDDDTFIMTYWHQWASPVWQPIRGEDRHVRRDGLEAAVGQVVIETERRWAGREGPVAIEIVLPSQLLNEPVELWRNELAAPLPRRLAIHYPFVIRSLERIRAGEWHRVWRSRWKTVTERTVRQGLVHCARPDQVAVQLDATLERDGTAVVLVLSEPPLPDSAGERQLLVGLRSGMPAIVWNRHYGQQEELCEVVRSMVDASLDTSQGVARLPQSVAELRQTAWREDPDASVARIGHGFVILWDDPERQPGRTSPSTVGSDTGRVRA